MIAIPASDQDDEETNESHPGCFSSFSPGETIRDKAGWGSWPEDHGFSFVAIEDTARDINFLTEKPFIAGRFTKRFTRSETKIKYRQPYQGRYGINSKEMSYSFTLLSPVLNGAFIFINSYSSQKIEGSTLYTIGLDNSFLPIISLELGHRYIVELQFHFDSNFYLIIVEADAGKGASQYLDLRLSRISFSTLELCATPDATGDMILHDLGSPLKEMSDLPGSKAIDDEDLLM